MEFIIEDFTNFFSSSVANVLSLMATIGFFSYYLCSWRDLVVWHICWSCPSRNLSCPLMARKPFVCCPWPMSSESYLLLLLSFSTLIIVESLFSSSSSSDHEFRKGCILKEFSPALVVSFLTVMLTLTVRLYRCVFYVRLNILKLNNGRENSIRLLLLLLSFCHFVFTVNIYQENTA